MKKWLTFLLLIITMGSTFCPCCMDDDCATGMAQEKGHSHHNQQDKGTCSPFFACGNCAPSVDPNHISVELTPSSPVVITHHSFYLLRLSSYTAPLFQPPQFA